MSGDESDGADSGDVGSSDAVGSPDSTGSSDAAKRPGTGEAVADPPAGSPWDLRLAWAEYRGHVAAATALFAVSLLTGLAMAVSGVDFLELLGIQSFEEILPEDFEFTAWNVFRNNARVYAILVVGAISAGLVTAFVLAFNGVLIGWVAGFAAAQVGAGPILALLAPHGVFELPAFWLGGGVGLRLVHLAVNYLRGARDHFLTRAEWWRTALLVGVGLAMVAVAAVIEVYVTPAIAEAIYGDIASPTP